MRPQLVALIVAASLTTGWLLASVVSPPVATLQDLPPRDTQREESVEQSADTSYTERLNLRLQKAPAPPVPRRNPFVFADRARQESRNADNPLPTAPIESAPIPAGPMLRLAGIGSLQTESGVVLTAIVSDGRSVHLARAGESVLGFTVIEVTDQSAVLAAADGTRHVLRLR
jgi:hypothetical protein